MIAISLAVDAPRGLREGPPGSRYQGAEAVLLGGFWAQLASGVTMVVVGPMLALQLRAERDARRAPPSRRRGVAATQAARLARGSGAEGAAT